MFIVKLQSDPDLWLAPWDGDPGRTLLESSAATFKSWQKAHTALYKARRYSDFQHAEIINKEREGSNAQR